MAGLTRAQAQHSLRKITKRQGITMTSVASGLGVSRPAVSQVQPMAASTLLRWVDLLEWDGEAGAGTEAERASIRQLLDVSDA